VYRTRGVNPLILPKKISTILRGNLKQLRERGKSTGYAFYGEATSKGMSGFLQSLGKASGSQRENPGLGKLGKRAVHWVPTPLSKGRGSIKGGTQRKQSENGNTGCRRRKKSSRKAKDGPSRNRTEDEYAERSSKGKA